MMKNKKLFSFSLFLIISLSFVGCNLAKPEIVETVPGRLVGAVITEEYIDTFDMDKYLNDNIDEIIDGGNVEVEGTSGYENRIYAKDLNQIDKEFETTDFSYSSDVVFEGVEGINLFIYDRYFAGYSEDFYDYPITIFDDEIVSGDLKIDRNQPFRQNLQIAGTVYISSDIDKDIVSVYVNPVYQDEDGRIYMTGGTGLSTNTEYGFSMSKSMDEVVELTVNDETMTRTTTVRVNFELKSPHKKIVLTEMNASDEVIAKHEYDPSDMPEYFVQKKGTEYIVGEFHSTSIEGEEVVEREIYEYAKSGDSVVTYLYENGDYTLTEKRMPIEWYIGRNSAYD